MRNARGFAHGIRAAFVNARALLDPTLALLAAGRGTSKRLLGARLRRRVRPRGGALARRRLAMLAELALAARCTRCRAWRPCCVRRCSRSPRPKPGCARHEASPIAPLVRSSVLVLSSNQPLLCLPLTASRASAASALGSIAALVHAVVLSLAPGCYAGGSSCSLRNPRGFAHGVRAAFVGARALIDPNPAARGTWRHPRRP